jgi:tRNA 2-(methylsulfanyl)-N6-isopentenyladenosine37 hydroxylase
MLSLQSASDARWLAQVDASLDDVLIDHAHCEKKAAGVAMNLLFSYVDHVELARAMTEIVNEELEHFRLVLDLLERRGIPFRKLTPSSATASGSTSSIRKDEPARAVDRLLVAGLIEARSCERFSVLADHVADPELRDLSTGACLSRRRGTTAPTSGWPATVMRRRRSCESGSTGWPPREAEIIAAGDPFRADAQLRQSRPHDTPPRIRIRLRSKRLLCAVSFLPASSPL